MLAFVLILTTSGKLPPSFIGGVGVEKALLVEVKPIAVLSFFDRKYFTMQVYLFKYLIL